jgi:hypothetical protein
MEEQVKSASVIQPPPIYPIYTEQTQFITTSLTLKRQQRNQREAVPLNATDSTHFNQSVTTSVLLQLAEMLILIYSYCYLNLPLQA